MNESETKELRKILYNFYYQLHGKLKVVEFKKDRFVNINKVWLDTKLNLTGSSVNISPKCSSKKKCTNKFLLYLIFF